MPVSVLDHPRLDPAAKRWRLVGEVAGGVGQHPIRRAILGIRRPAEHEHRAHGGGQATRPEHPRERVAARRLVEVRQQEHRQVLILSELGERGERPPYVLVAVGVHIGPERGGERVNDEQSGAALAGKVADPLHVIGQAYEVPSRLDTRRVSGERGRGQRQRPGDAA